MDIRDPLHGTITFTDFEERIIDTPEFQRLRRIKQLALTHLIYPGATHTRFEHSLGTLELAGRICRKLGIEEERARVYALVHDIGHAAFSHESEGILSRYFGNHEKKGKEIMLKGELGDVLKEKFSEKEIAEMNEGINGEVISSALGADRMDYLARDAHHTGVAYGIIDIERIVSTLKQENGQLILKSSGIEAAESLMIGRFLMFSAVYFHKTVRIASAMLRKAIEYGIEKGMDPELFMKYGDDEILYVLVKEGSEHAKKLHERRLYKVAGNFRMSKENEKMLGERFGEEIIMDIPSYPPRGRIGIEGGGNLEELSALVNSLKEAEEKRKRILVLCKEEELEEIRGKLKEVAKDLDNHDSN
ncbi:HD domain-containing protein [Candidatus Micrarchaeota archaeon]|nr:HD domain-containing protein [Candidatus Micrarchaeota archaeon]